jgi:hypothetical protein
MPGPAGPDARARGLYRAPMPAWFTRTLR